MAHVLRVYKHAASGYTDVTNEMDGGYTDIEVTQVVNAPGSLQFDLEATTPAMLHEWLDEAATVQLWDGVCLGRYVVDSYRPRWSDLKCRVECVGILAKAIDAPFNARYPAGSGVTYTGAEILEEMVAAVPELTWAASGVTGASGTVDAMAYADCYVMDGLTELAETLGLYFWVDADGVFRTAPLPTTPALTFTMSEDTWEFDTRYSAADIVNRLVLLSDSGRWVFDDTASQAVYGVRERKVSVTGIVTSAVAEAWADATFATLAWPIQQIGIETPHSDSNVVGAFAEIVGLGDGRTYEDIISQVSWNVGDTNDKVHIGHQLPTLQPPASIAGKDAVLVSSDASIDGGASQQVDATFSGSNITARVSYLFPDLVGNESYTDVYGCHLTLEKWNGTRWEFVESAAGFSNPSDGDSAVFAITLPGSGSVDYRVKVDRSQVTLYDPAGDLWDSQRVFQIPAAASNVVSATASALAYRPLPAGGGAVRGVITVDNLDGTCTFQPDAGGAAWTDVAIGAHVTVVLDTPCWVVGTSG